MLIVPRNEEVFKSEIPKRAYCTYATEADPRPHIILKRFALAHTILSNRREVYGAYEITRPGQSKTATNDSMRKARISSPEIGNYILQMPEGGHSVKSISTSARHGDTKSPREAHTTSHGAQRTML